MTLTTRAGKGSPLTNAEMDANWALLATSTVEFAFDGNGSALTAGLKGYLEVPWTCTVTAWKVLGNAAGNAQVDIFNDPYTTFGTDTSMVGGGTKPNLVAQTKNTAAPAGWTSTSILAGNQIGFSLASVSGLTRLTISLKVSKT